MDTGNNSVIRRVVITNPSGLHARPASLFVQKANTFTSKIVVRKGDQKVDGKSIMGILMLEAGKDSEIFVEAYGDDALQAVDALEIILTQEAEEDEKEKGAK